VSTNLSTNLSTNQEVKKADAIAPA